MSRDRRSDQPGIRILIADDHDEVRQSLGGVLAEQPGLEVIAEARNGKDALELARAHQPEIAILDVRMPGLNGIAASSRILRYSPGTAIIVLSLSHDEQHVASALLAGIQGYVAKEDAPECLAAAIRTIRTGKPYLSPAVETALARSGALAVSREHERELMDLFDRHAPALVRCAVIAGADEANAAMAVRESFVSYSFARLAARPVHDARSWLLVFVANLLFERCPIQPLQAGSAGLVEWCRAKLQPHPDLGEFDAYWSGTMPRDSQARLIGHVRRCPLCHLEWSLVAAGDPHTEISSESGCLCDLVVPAIRSQLINILRVSDITVRAAGLRDDRRRLNELIASELEMFFGTAAASRWKGADDFEAETLAPLQMFDQFLGGRVRSLAATVLPSFA